MGPSGGPLRRGHPERIAAVDQADTLVARRGKARYADLEQIALPRLDVLSKRRHGIVERVALDDAFAPVLEVAHAESELRHMTSSVGGAESGRPVATGRAVPDPCC